MTTEMVIDRLKVGNADDGQLEVTLRGKPEAIMHALVSGLDREALLQLQDALTTEIAKRHDRTVKERDGAAHE
jgi:hypothetical protein